MNFGEKLRYLRRKKGYTQEELGKKLDLTTRTISNYELRGIRPRYMDTYRQIADLFEVDVNELLVEGDALSFKARQEYGEVQEGEIPKILESMTGLFAGGELPEEDKDALFEAIQEVYWESKIKNKKD